MIPDNFPRLYGRMIPDNILKIVWYDDPWVLSFKGVLQMGFLKYNLNLDSSPAEWINSMTSWQVN